MSNFLGLEEDKGGPAVEQDLNREQLEAQVRSGANWFYWIAALSAINSVIYIAGASVSFLAGLGFTQLADALVDAAVENGLPSAMKVVAIVFNFLIVAVFALFGYYSNKRFAAAFIAGIALYLVDALLLLLLGVYLSAGFHAFALFFIIRGLLACRKLNAYRGTIEPIQVPPPPPVTL